MMHTMTGYSAKAIDELPTLWDGFAKLVRAGLDISAFTVSLLGPDVAGPRCPRRVLPLRLPQDHRAAGVDDRELLGGGRNGPAPSPWSSASR